MAAQGCFSAIFFVLALIGHVNAFPDARRLLAVSVHHAGFVAVAWDAHGGFASGAATNTAVPAG